MNSPSSFNLILFVKGSSEYVCISSGSIVTILENLYRFIADDKKVFERNGGRKKRLGDLSSIGDVGSIPSNFVSERDLLQRLNASRDALSIKRKRERPA